MSSNAGRADVRRIRRGRRWVKAASVPPRRSRGKLFFRNGIVPRAGSAGRRRTPAECTGSCRICHCSSCGSLRLQSTVLRRQRRAHAEDAEEAEDAEAGWRALRSTANSRTDPKSMIGVNNAPIRFSTGLLPSVLSSGRENQAIAPGTAVPETTSTSSACADARCIGGGW